MGARDGRGKAKQFAKWMEGKYQPRQTSRGGEAHVLYVDSNSITVYSWEWFIKT